MKIKDLPSKLENAAAFVDSVSPVLFVALEGGNDEFLLTEDDEMKALNVTVYEPSAVYV